MCVFVCVYVCVCARAHVCTHGYYMCTGAGVYVRACVHACEHVCVCVCVCACACACVRTSTYARQCWAQAFKIVLVRKHTCYKQYKDMLKMCMHEGIGVVIQVLVCLTCLWCL